MIDRDNGEYPARPRDEEIAMGESELGKRYERYGENGHSLDPELVKAWRHLFCDLEITDAGAVDGYFLESQFGLERLMARDAPQLAEYIVGRARTRMKDLDHKPSLDDVMREYGRFDYEVSQQEQFQNAYDYLRWIGIGTEQLDLMAMSTDEGTRNSVKRLARIMRDGSMALLVERLREESPERRHDFFDVLERALQMMRENNLVGEMVEQGEHTEMLKTRRGAVAAAVRRLLFDSPDSPK